ncbi:MAG: NTP transferase domain-containing protein [Nitrososphaera sp.]
MIAVIMCGGKASRMQQGGIEKPILKVDGVTMVERVIFALASSNKFDKVVAAVSPNTPATNLFLKSRGIETIETSGEGYSIDLSYVLSYLKPLKVMIVPCDMPLLNSQVVNEIFSMVQDLLEQKPPPEVAAVSIMLEKRFVERIGVKPSIVLDQLCHSGITIFNTTTIGTEPVEERYLVMNQKEIAVNVNTKEEMELAEKLLV